VVSIVYLHAVEADRVSRKVEAALVVARPMGHEEDPGDHRHEEDHSNPAEEGHDPTEVHLCVEEKEARRGDQAELRLSFRRQEKMARPSSLRVDT